MARFYYGGQAVIEGVMMRGRKAMVTAVRRPDGQVVMDVQALAPRYTGMLRKTPLARGIIVLIESIELGLKSLLYSANTSLGEEEQVSSKALWGMVALGLGLAVAIFFIAPLLLTRLLNPYLRSSLAFNLVEGGIRLVIFIVYLKAVGLVPDIRRVFHYHGAEHKTVNAYEHGVALEVNEVRRYNTAHVRCGTSFLFVVMLIALIVFALIGRPSFWAMVASRIVLVPVIASLSYEVIHFGANHAKNVFVRAMLVPGLLLQKLTTAEPDDGQIEVAVSALRKVREIDQAEEARVLA